MLLNEHTAISTSHVLLVPYSQWHVPRYHEWMKDEEIQQATASEPLTLEEEYGMQRSWRQDPDKLTFIICLPVSSQAPGTGNTIKAKKDDSDLQMLGDINLFLRIDEDPENDDATNTGPASEFPQIIGEIELMIAEKRNHRRGFGRAALRCFLRYIIEHEDEILREFVPSTVSVVGEKPKLSVGEDGRWKEWRFSGLSAKIGERNWGSLALFESVGFQRVAGEANFFGEVEVRRERGDLGGERVREGVEGVGIGGYEEVDYVQS